MTKAFAIQTIQRGKGADPQVVLAGTVFDASDTELLHLTPAGAIRRPTKEELAVAAWDSAEGVDANDAARAAVAAEFGGPVAATTVTPKTAATPAPKLTKAQQKAADEAAAAEAQKKAADEATAAAAAAASGGDGGNGGGSADDLSV